MAPHIPHTERDGFDIAELFWPRDFSGAHSVNEPPRVLIACEFSGAVRDAMRRRGIDAWSCDLLETEADPRWHIQGDAIEVAYDESWDGIIMHPPCTHTAVSGARHFAAKRADGRQKNALEFIAKLWNAPARHKALEQPVSITGHTIGRKADQVIQPWQFGHGETKATCFWLHNLPKLVPTQIVEGREPRVHRMAPGPDRWKDRSRTFQGVADAMAGQWGRYLQRVNGEVTSASPSVSVSSHESAYSGKGQCDCV